MAVYVDPPRTVHVRMSAWFRTQTTTCHLMADTQQELLQVAVALGMRPEWQHNDHFDLFGRRMRAKVIRLFNAREVTGAELVALRKRLRKAAVGDEESKSARAAW